MSPLHGLFFILTLGGAPAVETICQQAAPSAIGAWVRSSMQTRAVVLIHGFHYHFRDKSVPKAELRPWQKPDSALVKELAKTGDVYVFAYGQNVALDEVVKHGNLAQDVARLRKMGYTDVVLLGHSAGGLIARQFVEDHPDAGVTKVIQVCAPNAGSPLATLVAPKTQRPFLDCLTIENRRKCLESRAEKLIPDHVQFVCVIAKTTKGAESDGVVPCASQWSADLQKQCIPVVPLVASHRGVVRDRQIAETLADLVREKQGRWTAAHVEKTKKAIFR